MHWNCIQSKIVCVNAQSEGEVLTLWDRSRSQRLLTDNPGIPLPGQIQSLRISENLVSIFLSFK